MTTDEYRVRVCTGRPTRTLRHPFPRRGWLVQIDHVSQWDEHGDSEQLDGADWFATQDEATARGIGMARSIHAEGGCWQCTDLGIPTGHLPLVVHVGPDTPIDERESFAEDDETPIVAELGDIGVPRSTHCPDDDVTGVRDGQEHEHVCGCDGYCIGPAVRRWRDHYGSPGGAR